MTKHIPRPWSAAIAISTIQILTCFITAPSWGDSSPPPADTQPAAGANGANQAIFDRERTYQGRGGEIRFTVAGDIKSQPDMLACLQWKPSQKNCTPSLPARRVKENQEPPSINYAFTIPPRLSDASHRNPPGPVSIVPDAQVVVHA